MSFRRTEKKEVWAEFVIQWLLISWKMSNYYC